MCGLQAAAESIQEGIEVDVVGSSSFSFSLSAVLSTGDTQAIDGRGADTSISPPLVLEKGACKSRATEKKAKRRGGKTLGGQRKEVIKKR
jgi:hypothetical protein